MPAYDESILVTMSDRLYARAARIVMYLTMLGALGGAIAGAVALADTEELAAMLVGVVVGGGFGGLVGYFLAWERAFMLRLQAQMIMVQVQIERNTRGSSFASRSA